MKNLTWQNPGQLFAAQELIKITINYVAELRVKTYISREQYDSAHIYMDIFENESGVFVDGEIAPDRLHLLLFQGVIQYRRWEDRLCGVLFPSFVERRL